MEKTGLAGYLIPGIEGALLAVAILLGNPHLSLGILAGPVVVLFAYSEWINRRGEICGSIGEPLFLALAVALEIILKHYYSRVM